MAGKGSRPRHKSCTHVSAMPAKATPITAHPRRSRSEYLFGGFTTTKKRMSYQVGLSILLRTEPGPRPTREKSLPALWAFKVLCIYVRSLFSRDVVAAVGVCLAMRESFQSRACCGVASGRVYQTESVFCDAGKVCTMSVMAEKGKKHENATLGYLPELRGVLPNHLCGQRAN